MKTTQMKASEPDMMLRLTKAGRSYELGSTQVQALRDVSLQIRTGEFVAIMGPSGSGKSTLMNILGLLDTLDQGTYELNGKAANGLSGVEQAALRGRSIGFIFQQFHLLPYLNALENVILPQIYSERALDRGRGMDLLHRVGLQARFEHRPSELSGGQQQRVAIARAMVNEPLLLLADEPTGNLDSQSEMEVLDLLKELNGQGVTIVLVTHEEHIAKQAKRLIRMRDGRIESDEVLIPEVAAAKAKAITGKSSGSLLGFMDQLAMNMRQASRSLKGHKLRTLLSTLGITVGVASVVAMISIGNGFRRAIDQQMASLNQNVLMIQPGTSSNRDLNSEALKLTVDTAQQMLSSLPQLESVIALSMGQVNVTQGGKIVQAPLLGVGAGFFASHSLQAMRGELETLDGNTEEQAAVLGSELAQDLFGRKDPIGQYIRINRSQFEIVGVLKKPEITIYDEDKSLFLTQKTAMRRVTGSPFIDVIEAIPRAGVSIKDLETEARGFLEETYKLPASLGKDAFKFVDYNSFREKVDKISLAIRIFLGVIASISLMVGGIGIANIMLVSVTERTREVGLRKALGARTLSIFHQFLVESMYICLLGGMLGAGLAAALCLSVSHMTDQIQAEVSLGTLALALGFSLVVGVIAGLFPAQRAAGLKPVEALRSH